MASDALCQLVLGSLLGGDTPGKEQYRGLEFALLLLSIDDGAVGGACDVLAVGFERPESLEEVRAANRRVIIRIDALPPELLLRLGLESKKKKKLPDAAAPTEKKLEDVDNLGPFELPDVKSEEQPDAPKQ